MSEIMTAGSNNTNNQLLMMEADDDEPIASRSIITCHHRPMNIYIRFCSVSH